MESTNTPIRELSLWAEKHFQGEGSGHDWWHIWRVWQCSIRLAREEGADSELVQMAALLHDIADHKFHGGDLELGPRKAYEKALKVGCDDGRARRVAKIVAEVSYKGADVPTPVSSLEAAIVQDADRLDAMGAIGIARAFAYGGHRGNPIFIPGTEPEMHETFEAYASSRGSTIHHFYEKLLLLKSRLNTDSARKIAEGRHGFLVEYLERFYAEWKGEA